MLRTKKILTTALIIAAFSAGIWSYKARAAHDDAPPGGAPPAPAVSIAAVQERDVEQYNDFSGRLVAVDQADIRPRLSGTIDSVQFKDGGVVKKGDLLFTIDPRPYAAEVGKAEGALASAKAQAVLSQTEYARGQKLIADKTISQHDFDQRKNAINVADANVKTAQAALDAAKLNLDYTKITAPIDGRAGRAEVTVGNLVEAGSAPVLTTVISDNPIYADFDMDEASYLQYAGAAAGDLSKIPVRMGLTGEQGAPHEGHLESFDNRINAASGTIRVRATFDNKDRLLVPGLFAHVELGSPGSQHVLLISDRAIGTDQDKKFVYVVGADNKVAYREIKLGASMGNLHIVADGLKPGDNIIVNGLQRVHPGIEVKPDTVPMDDSQSPAAAGADATAPEAADKDAGKGDTDKADAAKTAPAAGKTP